ncbi:unnamed protein product [Closterium sp. NIES-65]|nr:unnamed protein product [Closterium sp. NIES-65]
MHHGESDYLLLQVPIRWTPPHSPRVLNVAMHVGETGNPSVKSRGFPVALHLRPDDASQQPTAGSSFGNVPSIVSPRHCPLPPHPPHWQSSPDVPRGSAAAGPRELPRQHCGRPATRGAADACAAVARHGGGEIILETESGETAPRAVTTEPLVPEKPTTVSGRPASHEDVSCFLPVSRDNFNRRRSFEETTLYHRWHAEAGARVAPLPPTAVEKGGSFASNESDGPGESSWEKEFLDWTEECAVGAAATPRLETAEAARRASGVAPPTPPALAQTSKLTEDVRPKYGNFSLRYLGGSKAAHRVEPHEDGEKAHDMISPRDDGHSRGSGKHSRASGGHYNLFSRSSSREDAHSRGSGGDDAHSRGSGGDDGHSRASGGDDAHSRTSSGHYNLFSRSSTRKERAVAAATSGANAVATAVAPGEPSQVARQMTSGSTATSYCGSDSSFGDRTAGIGFPYHDPFSASPHARAFPPRLPHPPSPSSSPFPSVIGVATAAATPATAAEAEINAMKKRLGAKMQFSTWEQQQKERKQQQDAAASAAQRALKQAQEELLIPKYNAPGHAEPPHPTHQAPPHPPFQAPHHAPQQAPLQQPSPPKTSVPEAKLLETKLPPGVPIFGSKVEHSGISSNGDHGGMPWGREIRRGYEECGSVESGAVGFGGGVARSVSRDSADGGGAWRRDGGRSNTPPVEHGMWGREQGRSGGECGGVRLGDVGRGDRECSGAWRNNWECNSMGWDHGESYNVGSNASSVDNRVASSSHGQSSSHHHARDSAYRTHNAHHYSPPVSHVSHGYADSAAGAAAAALKPSPPGSTVALSGASGHVAPSHVAPSNVASGHVASSGGCRVFSPEQLIAATNGFHSSNLLGAGAFGQVFKGNLLGCVRGQPAGLRRGDQEASGQRVAGRGGVWHRGACAVAHAPPSIPLRSLLPALPSLSPQVFKGSLLGCEVAIKRLEGNGWQGEEEYGTEVHVLSRMRHPHIVLLMGHCPAINCLVYEFLPGGDLSHHLCSAAASHPASSGGGAGASTAGGAAATSALSSLCRPLSWPDRIRILSEISGALLYLHQHSPPIAHRDLKPQNILLDTSLRAKLADVGLARLIDCGNGDEYGEGGGGNVTARVRGTVGYIDPEELVTCEVSVLGDVYALGVVMLQMLMGDPVVKQTVKAVNVIIGRLDDSGGKWDRGAAAEVAAIAICCTSRRRASRPDLEREVHEVLMQLAEESAGSVERLQDAADSHLLCPLSKSFLEREVHEVLMQLAEKSAGSVERQQDAADSHLLCPLSKMRMREPVVAADGYTYERKEIEKWMETNSRSPITGEPFEHPMLTPNNAMNVIIQ